VVLTSYTLNEQELAVVRGEIERDELREVIGVVAGDAAGALNEIVEEVERLIPEPPKEKQEPENPNPFTALFDFKREKATNAADGERDSTTSFLQAIRGDSEIEKVVRSQAILEARRRCLDFYGRCKQALKMACC
jgi:hypothetical protein